MTDGSMSLAGKDDRIIRESGTEARIALIVGPVVQAAGFRLVRVRLSGQNGLTLQIMAEREDGTMTVEDCETLSRALSPALDVEDPIEKQYNLEVSSPGIDRPLVRISDFAAWSGHAARIETHVPVGKRKRFRGLIVGNDENSVEIVSQEASGDDEARVQIDYEAISEARLVLTDDLIRDALKKDKKARQERKRRGDDPIAEDAFEQEDETATADRPPVPGR